MNTQEYIEYLIQQQLNNNNQQSPYDTLNGYKRGLNTVNNWGNNLSNAGDYLSGVNNKFANKLGNGMTKVGNSLQNGVSTIKNAPQAVFNGYAQAPNPAIESALADTLGTTAGTTAGATAGADAGMSAIGNAVADTAGSSLAGIGSTIGTEAATTGAATGAAAGGAAAGGSAGAAAAAGPIGALIALGIMGLQGTNRKRAKQGGENLMKQTNQMAKAVENDTSNQDFANKMVQQSQNNIAENIGQYGQGNIDLYNRPQVKNNDGTISTVRSMSFNDGKNEVLIPTVSDNGKILTEDEAIKNYYNTGKYLGKFNSVEDANNYAQKLHNEQDKYYNNGVITGGASPITEADIDGLSNEMAGQGYTPQQQMQAMQGLNGGNKNIANLIQKYNVNVPQNPNEVALAQQGLFNQDGTRTIPTQEGQVTETVQPDNVQLDNTENVKQGLLSKLMSGIGDFAQGYQENRNNAFSPENLNRDRFAETTTTTAPSQQLIDYQNGLRQQGIDENVVNAVAQGKNSGNADIDEWIKANPEALKPVTTTQTTYTGKEKGKMARLGEGFGTVGRALQKPAVQALLAGGLSTALTGNPMYGLGQAYKFANARAMNDVYRDVLKQNGIQTPDAGMFGNITSGDMKNIGSMAETHAWHQYLNQKNADELARKVAKDEADKKYKEEMIDIRKNDSNTKRMNAETSRIRVNKPTGRGSSGGRKGGSGKAPKPQQHPDWNKDLAGYAQRLDDPRYATKVSQLKAGFINKYGVDPDKFIKD